MKLTADQQKVVTSLIASVETALYLQFGIELRFEVCTLKLVADNDDMLEIMAIISQALGMTIDEYYTVSRRRKFVDLKCLTCYMIRSRHPQTTLAVIAKVLDLDHTTIIHHLTRASNYLESKEPEFMVKYRIVNNILKDPNATKI